MNSRRNLEQMITPVKQLADASCPAGVPQALIESYQGVAAGCRVHVVSSGPSAAAFANYELTAGDDHVVVTNGAIIPYAYIANTWLLMESTLPTCAPWFVQDESIFDQIQVVLDASCAGHLESIPSRITCYSEAFWRDVIWCHRWPHGKHGHTSLRDPGAGLYFRTSSDEPEGSVTLQAIHLAGIMGAAECHTWGTELMFANGEQHVYGDRPYREGDGVTDIVRFAITPNGVAAVTDDGRYSSTPYFIRSADAIRDIIDAQDEMKIVNHSGGLLDWSREHLAQLYQCVNGPERIWNRYGVSPRD